MKNPATAPYTYSIGILISEPTWYANIEPNRRVDDANKFLIIICRLVKPDLSWIPNSPISRGISWAIKAIAAIIPVPLSIKNADPKASPSMALWKKSPTKNNQPCVLFLGSFKSSSWWWWKDLKPFSIKKKNNIAARAPVITLDAAPSSTPCGNKSLKAAISNTPAANGVPNFTK